MHRPLVESDLFPDGPLRRLGRHVTMLSEIQSTNAYLLAEAEIQEDGAVACAEYQTAGRGRQGRRWLSPRGSSILLSVLLTESEKSPRLVHAALHAALATAEAIEAETTCRAELRWPNDVVIGGRKVAGVLAESKPRARDVTRRAVVVGVGLNCLQQRGHFGPGLSDIATSLEIECSQPVDRPALARRLVERLDCHFSGAACDWDDLRAAWTAHCDDLGARVTLEENSQRFTGTVLEIADNGDLLVQLDSGGRRRFGPATTTRLW